MDIWDIIDATVIVFVSSKVIKSLLEREQVDTCPRPYSRQLTPEELDSDLDSDW